jgi:hypothetical protein
MGLINLKKNGPSEEGHVHYVSSRYKEGCF